MNEMSATAEPLIPRKVWTRAEVNRLSWDGLSLELICGELIDKMGKRPPHVLWKGLLGKWLREQFGDHFVRTEDPIDITPEDNPTSEPEPDLAVTRKSLQATRGVNPKPEDLRLVVEISDSSYDFDMAVKAALYARAKIVEFWVVDVREESTLRLIRHCDPAHGEYRDVHIYYSDDVVSFSGREFRLEELA